MKVIIVGGSANGLTLANLIGDEHEITIVEKEKELADKIANETHALVINGDATDISLLKEAGLNQADALVSTASDKDNLMICQIAKSENVPKIIPIVRDPKNEELFTKLGLSHIVSSVGTNVTAIKNLLHQIGDVRILAQLGGGEVQIIEPTIAEGSSLIGQPAKLKYAIIAVVYRSGELMIPQEKTMLEQGDVLL